jgi:hypothetical protein
MAEPLELFISHSSTDASLARALVLLIERTLKLHAKSIRCTSVPGYKLPVGADTDEQLRREIFVAKAFIGILTPASLESAYVLFELGARWGARKHLAPTLAAGADASYLRGPLTGLNATRLDERRDVVQLLDDLSEFLGRPLEPAASYQDAIDSVVTAAQRMATAPPTSVAERDLPTLSDHDVALLVFISQKQEATTVDVAAHLGVIHEKANYYLERLEGFGMLERHYSHRRSDTVFTLLQQGRETLVERNLL